MRSLRNHSSRRGTVLLFLLLFLLAAGCDQRREREAATPAASTPAYVGTIIAAGDSLTAGLGVAPEDAWPALLQQKLAENGQRWRVLNSGSSGETSSGLLARSRWLLAQHPQIVIVATGANDGLRGIPPPLLQGNLVQIVRLFREGGATVVLAGMQIVQNLGQEYAGQFAAVYPAVAQQEQCIFIPFLLAGVAGEPSLNQADTIHPNEDGHRLIVATVYPYVLEAIASRR